MNKRNPNFRYVNIHGLTLRDRERIKHGEVYKHRVPYIPYSKYLYPIKSDGSLANTTRYIESELAQELYDLYQISQVLETQILFYRM